MNVNCNRLGIENIYAVNRDGIQLLDYYDVDESELDRFQPLSSAYAVIFVKDKLLLGFNKYRKQWEAAAGKIEAGETPRCAAIRELYEENHQRAGQLAFKGVFRIFDPKHQEIRYRSVFWGTLDALEPFHCTNVDERILLWDFKSDIGYVDAVDIKMIEMINLQAEL